ncbi:MAG TPA: membrane protein insertion efficiency factor YidD [Kiritimatiellia bacterium]|nr:membrane protein insertion efficiency factor YidD [Kiritimatiellia bacterium]HMO99906.1 membrane protein insertion efficiency factor YidD [Kiritimatiellia bacterium]HMP96047.1 membrane protein insertion efficiency factor YidD [Kiritimatiellia bacterium]
MPEHPIHPGQKAIIGIIRFYQRTAPASLRNTCRFEPSCSHYAIGAIEKHGVISGLARSLRRIGSCREPNGGVDNP